MTMEDDEVPPFVEFNQQHMNDNNDDCDDDLLSIVADDKQQHDEVASVDDDNDVTKQDLNAMKQMIYDMLLHPELLHQSPVYSKTVISCQDDNSREEAMATTSQAAAASIPTPKNTVKSTSVSYSTSRRRTTQSSSSTTTAWPISRRTTQSSMSYCQECSDSPAEVSKLSVAVTRYPSSGQKSTKQQTMNFKKVVVSQASPLPFSRSSRAA